LERPRSLDGGISVGISVVHADEVLEEADQDHEEEGEED
jgi:hypothetical protein